MFPETSFLSFLLASDLNPITNSDTEIVISPAVISELMDSIDPNETGIDLMVRRLIQEIIDNARIFTTRFEHSYFLKSEPIHQFTGLEFRSSETSLVENRYDYRLVLQDKAIGIFTIDEVPIDDMYDIRLVIAESQLPEFSEDTHT